jgi:hypothetical protein
MNPAASGSVLLNAGTEPDIRLSAEQPRSIRCLQWIVRTPVPAAQIQCVIWPGAAVHDDQSPRVRVPGGKLCAHGTHLDSPGRNLRRPPPTSPGYISRSAAMARRPRGEQSWDVSGPRDPPAPRPRLPSSSFDSSRVWVRVSEPRRGHEPAPHAPRASSSQGSPAGGLPARRPVSDSGGTAPADQRHRLRWTGLVRRMTKVGSVRCDCRRRCCQRAEGANADEFERLFTESATQPELAGWKTRLLRGDRGKRAG